ncbi:MAG: endopeptidase La, partial [Clostridia bacterium]|nr:endopeptidase La [Clostridia bacterium]
KKSIEALNVAMASNRTIFLLTQKNIAADEPKRNDLYDIGCVAKIKQILRLSNDTVRVLVEGCYRAKLIDLTASAPCFYADVERLDNFSKNCRPVYKDALLRNAKGAFDEYARVAPKISPDIIMSVIASEDIGDLADFITHNIPVEVDDKQYILEQTNPQKRLKLVISMLRREKEILGIEAKINEKVRGAIDENKREYYLREQLKAINEELYGKSDPDSEYEKYYKRIGELKCSEDVKNRLSDEVDRLSKMPHGSHEATVVLNYIDTCLSLPWGVYTEGKINLAKSRKILDRDHYGLEKVKERIIELLAVYNRVPDIKGQIICLVGPPGVGKTSIVRSIAECMGRKYARVSLGGVTDEAEMRGHRKTYIGAMPGRIINAIKNAGSQNPVILLDEVDKLGSSYKGDPSSAMLEILDSEQNSTFHDHYIDMPFDLGRVLFITTANDASSIPAPLRDRMEIIELGSYTREEKFKIAKSHLVKKQIAGNGLKVYEIKFTDSAVYKIIDAYTREAGVRQLNRIIGSLCRKSAARIVLGECSQLKITPVIVNEFLGTEKFKPDIISRKDEVGVVNGLAWT